MTHSVLIKNALIVNEGTIDESDLRIRGHNIDRIDSEIQASPGDQMVEARGQYLLPGMIDDQVHFREPGLTHKGTIATESRAAVAGGITSYMEMPNVNPATTSIDALEKKFVIAEQSSMANYSFYLGATEDNLDQIKLLSPQKHCGVKVFMGASTGDLLVENPKALDAIFCESPILIVTHCESSPIIQQNLARLSSSGKIPIILDRPKVRDTEACFASSSYAVNLAKKHHSQLHVLHITTEKELSLFTAGPIEDKHITAEACVHHLWFSDQDYLRLGNLIKCNPSIKSSKDRDALIQALHSNQIDIIATDHAPHTLEEKQQGYKQAPAGLPLVEQALLSLLDIVTRERLSIEQVVDKTAHNPAKRYAIENRGFIREGYYADLVLVDMNQSTLVSNKNTRYHCGWTPFDNHQFSSSIRSTWVNGQRVFNGHQLINQSMPSKRLTFNR
jgi:dihydroorotase